MSAIAISAECICDLPAAITDKLNIHIFSVILETDKGEFLDGIEVFSENIEEYLVYNNRTLSSKPLPVDEYEKYFAKKLQEGRQVFHLSASEPFSGALANAEKAAVQVKHKFPHLADNIVVMSSKGVSSGYGLLLYKAAQFAKTCDSLELLVGYVYDAKVRHAFLASRIDWLNFENRLSYLTQKKRPFFRDQCPCVEVKKGEAQVVSYYRGSISASYKLFLRRIMSGSGEIDDGQVFIACRGVPESVQNDFINTILKYVVFTDIVVSDISASVSMYSGLAFLGLAFLYK